MAIPLPRRLLAFDEVRSVAHGLSSTAVGKPIGWNAAGQPVVWQDHATPQVCDPVAILQGVLNANTLKISSTGDVIEVPDTLLPANMPVDGGSTNSRWLYWDQSLDVYKHAAPGDSQLITESIYWVGPSATAGYSVCLTAHPNRPSAGVGTSLLKLRRVVGKRIGAALTPTSGSPYSLNPAGFTWAPTSPALAEMNLSTNGSNNRLTYIGSGTGWYMVTLSVEGTCSSISLGNLFFEFNLAHRDSGGLLLTTPVPITFYLDDTQFYPKIFANLMAGIGMSSGDYLEASALIVPSVGADFANLGYVMNLSVEQMYG
ncbi:MAG: hypothetical protein U0795_20135 [Pirellulales bacterium]